MSESRLRLFAAIYPPPSAVGRLLEHLRSASTPEHRETPPEQVHLTIQFIGDRSSHELDDVKESVRRSAAGLPAFRLLPLHLRTLPSRGPARLIACETDVPPALLELHRRLSHRLARNPRDRDDERFLPHLTLCRFTSPRPFRLELAVDGPEFPVTEVMLVRSVLKPQGAIHAEVLRIPLDG